MKKAKTKPKTRKETLPCWDLSHLVKDPAPCNIAAGMKKALRAAADFEKTYGSGLSRLSGAAFGRALVAYEDISAMIGRYYAYASLNRATQLSDPAAAQLYQTVSEEANAVYTHLLPFRLGVNRLPAAALKKFMKDKTVKRYAPFIDDLRARKPHDFDESVEKILYAREITGHAAWIRLFDETSARLRFPVGKKMLTDTEVFHKMLSRDAKKRKAAAQAVEKVYAENIGVFGLTLNTIAKIRATDDDQRGFKTPVSSRNLDNQVEDETVEALVSAVRDSYGVLSHRYFKLKAKWMGKKKLDYWDRNAPLPFSTDKKTKWSDAQDIVLKAYGDFHPDMARIGQRFFDEGWIDARPRAGKDSGAFSASTVPQVHPYILMNYKGDIGDVMTLAHELGHGIHQVLSAKQGYLMASTPLTLAETASVFGEMLTFRSLLDTETNTRRRRAMIANKVEDMLNTVVRQIAFHNFELAVHTERRKGELTPGRLGDIWMETQRESLGPAFRFTPGYKNFWAYIPHFYHAPFYVYAYAFGDCLVNALYGAYLDSEKGFAEKYLNLLKAGGTQRYDKLLKPFGLNAKDPLFWKRGLSVIADLIDQLESAENAATSRALKKGR